MFIFAGGGTGGHLYPALAVAQQLIEARDDAGVVFACSNRPIDRRILAPLDYAIVPQPIRPLPRNLRSVPGFLLAWWRSRTIARRLLDDLKPAAVLGTGGFAAAPLVRQAAKAHLPTALLNPDAVPGKANRYLAGHADVVFTQFDSTVKHFAADIASRVRSVGCPIRGGFATADRDEAAGFFNLDPNRRTLLVNGGSQGAANINEAVAMLGDELDRFAGDWQMLHITGLSYVEEVNDSDGPGSIPTLLLKYCDRMDLAYAAADLALCRGGASTAAELTASGTPAVIMPYPYHADDHQRLNAGPLESAGAAIVCTDAADATANTKMLRDQLLGLMDDPQRLEQMHQAAISQAHPDAAKEIAAWMLQHV